MRFIGSDFMQRILMGGFSSSQKADSSKCYRDYLDYVVCGFVIWVSGMATQYFREVQSLLIMFPVALIYLLAKGAILNRNYILACFVWFIYIFLSMLKYQGDNLFWPFVYFVRFTIVFALIRYFGQRFFGVYVKCIYHLSLLSLVLFSWQLLSVNTILAVWREFDLSGGLYEKPYLYYEHAFFYTIHQFEDVAKGFPRNSGFCWEPGAFACFLLIALFFQSIFGQGGFKQNRKIYFVFLAALLTTQSTTGLLGFFVILYINFVRNTGKSAFGFWIAIGAGLLGVAFLLPAQVEKIESQLSVDLYQHINRMSDFEFETSLGRFQSLQILAMDVLDNPILGIGANRSDSWLAKNGINLNPTSGLGNMFATYGVFLMIPYIFFMYRSSAWVSRRYSLNSNWALLVLLTVVGISFSVMETPVFLLFALFSLFYKDQYIR